MGALVVSGGRGDDAVSAGLKAAPHRGLSLRVGKLGAHRIGVASRADSTDAWIGRSGRLIVGFAGHLGNRAELARELELAPSENPAVILMRAWGVWGEAAARRLRGYYGAVVSDGKELWCFRDHFGFGTLFYRDVGEGIVIGSEAKQVTAAAGIPRQPDLDNLERLFWGQSDDGEPPGVIAGVERVPPATMVHWNARGRRTNRYWDPSNLVETASMSLEEAKEETYRLVDQAVSRTLTGNDAVSLSGGIDSPTIAAVAAPRYLELAGSPLPSISTVYPDAPSVDESYYIDLVVDHLGLDSHTFVPGYRRLENIELWVDILDGPGSPAAYAALAEFLGVAKDLGTDNVLLGDLAEFVYDVRDHLLGHLIATGHWGTAARHWSFARESGRSTGSLIRETMVSLMPSRLAGVYGSIRKRPFTPLAPWAFDPSEAPDPNRRLDLERPVRQRWREMQTWYASGASSYSVEAFTICAEYSQAKLHRPLNDVDLVEFFISLPAHLKFPDGRSKSLVREAMRGHLPDEIVDRSQKTAFNEDTIARVDYDELRRWLLGTEYRMPRVDYEQLSERLDNRDMGFWELRIAHNLADYHAFASLWE